MTELEVLAEIAVRLGEIKDVLCLILGFCIFRVFERAASKKGFL